MRKITKLIIHCSASNSPLHDDIEVITRWHNERGFDGCGYHFFVTSSGRIQFGRLLSRMGAHVKGENHDSIGICMSGNNNFNDHQVARTVELVNTLLDAYGLTIDDVYGHNDFTDKKTCPNYSMDKFRAKLKEFRNVG